MPKSEKPLLCPFTILVDTAETFPFTFQGLRADSDQSYRPLIVETKRVCLGRYPDSLADYTLEGGYGKCHVERKSMEDAHGTLLGFKDGRRERFESELSNLKKIDHAAVVVECSFEDFLKHAPTHGKRSAAENQALHAKILNRSVISLTYHYGVPWQFAGSRRLAEQWTFRFLKEWWDERREAERAAAKADGKPASVESAADIEMQLANL